MIKAFRTASEFRIAVTVDMIATGTDIVPGVVSLCAMNLYLHGIGSTKDANDPPVDRADALAQPSGRKFDMILTNPPFGKKGGYTIERWVTCKAPKQPRKYNK